LKLYVICGIGKTNFYGKLLHFYGELKSTNNQQINQNRAKKSRLLWGIFAFLWGIEAIFGKNTYF